jgi:hypothetical protein
MQNELERKIELKQAAYLAARNTIIKKLGKDATKGMVLDVLVLATHMVITNNYESATSMALYDCEIFTSQLRALIEESQKDVKVKDCRGLM